MEHRYITYKEFKTEEFRKFTMDLKVDMFQLINSECQEYKEILGNMTYKKLQGAFNPFFNYYSTLEKVHSLVNKGLMKYENLRDAVLIDEMAVYTINNLDVEYQ